VIVVRRLLLPCVLVGLVALGACGDDASTLDPAATARAVGRAVDAEIGPKVTSTRCPEDLEREVGGTFTCTVTVQGAGRLSVDVRQTDEDGKLAVTPAAAIVTRKRIANELGASLAEQFDRSFTVRCSGAPTQVREPGSTSTCSARDATSRREVVVTVTDAAGSLSFEVAPPR